MKTYLLTGGTGKTSLRTAHALRAAGHDVLLASRRGTAPAPFQDRAIAFDWTDASTWDAPFETAKAKGSPITGVYLVAPSISNPSQPVLEFVEHVRTCWDVRRFVALSASPIEPDAQGPIMAPVHLRLMQLCENGLVEWCVLKPSWFMEQFTEMRHHDDIMREGKIYSATVRGRMPFVAVDDIGAMACHALADARPHNAAYFVLGPDMLSYDDVAQYLTSNTDRRVEHVKLSSAGLVARYTADGLSEEYATVLANLDLGIEAGLEERRSDDVRAVTGRPPKTFTAFVAENLAAFRDGKPA